MKSLTRVWYGLCLSIMLGAASRAPGHDFWLELSDYHPTPGATVSVTLKSGHAPLGETIPRMATAMPDFVRVDERGIAPVPGISGQNPAGRIRSPGRGYLTVAYVSQSRSITLNAEKFAVHLDHEGLENVQDARRAAGEVARPAREVYTKFAKALLRVDSQGPGAPPVVGHLLEIAPDSDPTAPGFDGSLTGRILFRGQAAPEVMVTAFSPGAREPVRFKTDSAGRFTLPLSKSGLWIIKAVHMELSSDPAYDWASTWASLSFRY